jgi:hypothetical protein
MPGTGTSASVHRPEPHSRCLYRVVSVHDYVSHDDVRTGGNVGWAEGRIAVQGKTGPPADAGHKVREAEPQTRRVLSLLSTVSDPDAHTEGAVRYRGRTRRMTPGSTTVLHRRPIRPIACRDTHPEFCPAQGRMAVNTVNFPTGRVPEKGHRVLAIENEEAASPCCPSQPISLFQLPSGWDIG